MKVLLAIFLIGIVFNEWPRGFMATLRSQAHSLLPRSFRIEAAALLCIIALSFLCDSVALRSIQTVKHPVGTALIQLGGIVGRNYNFWWSFILLYAVAKAFHLERAGKVLYGVLLSSAITAIVCNIIKLMFLRSRPAAGEGSLSFFNVAGYASQKGLYMSFPSGDVALVAGASAFLFFFTKNKSLRITLLLLPLLTGASRVYLNRHWPSDTLLAIGIGLLVAQYLWRCHRAEEHRASMFHSFSNGRSAPIWMRSDRCPPAARFRARRASSVLLAAGAHRG